MRLPLIPVISVALALAASLGLAQLEDAQGPGDRQAQRATDPPIFEREPYDEITVDAANGGGTFKVVPLDFPQRKVPENPDPNARLRVRLLDDPDTQAEIAWRHIAQVKLFHELVLAEAEALTAQQKFDEAYEHYAYLHEHHPQMPQLARSTQQYLYRNAAALFQQKRYHQTLALLEELHQQNAAYPGLTAALGNVSQQLMQGYVQQRRFLAARQLLERLAAHEDEAINSVVGSWKTRLQTTAHNQLQVARDYLAAGRYRQAHQAARMSLDIQPEQPDAAALLAEISQRYPMLHTGVTQLHAAPHVPAALDRVARRRQLLRRPLIEITAYTRDGPRYASPWGDAQLAADRRSITFDLVAANGGGGATVTGYDVSRRLLQKCDPSLAAHDWLWASLMQSVAVEDVFRVRVRLRRPHAQPLAVLASAGHAVGDDDRLSRSADYIADVASGAEYRFVHRQGSDGESAQAGPREIVELRIDDPDLALSELRRGRLDVVQRVRPAIVGSLADDETVQVGRFAVPSIHVLLPNYSHAYPATQAFRRAISYGIPRGEILARDLLEGADVDGCRVISGPLPVPDDGEAPWAYGYDERIEPLPYEPRLAATLLRVAEDEQMRLAEKGGQRATAIPRLIIGHVDDWLHRRACQRIVDDLTRIGIACERREFAADGPSAVADCHFVYAELAIVEPAVDVPRLFASESINPPSSYLSQAVRELAEAVSWQQARERLQKIHAIVHSEQSAIPLWQLVDHFAYRGGLQHVPARPVTLYENIGQWRVAASSGRDASRSSDE